MIAIGILNRITTKVFYFYIFLHHFIAKQIFPNSVIYVQLTQEKKKREKKTAVVILLELL